MKVTVTPKGPKRWLIEVYGVLPDGTELRRRKTQSGLTERGAREYGDGIWDSALKGEQKKRARVTPTVAEYAKEWLQARLRRGLSSAKTNQYELARLMPALGEIRIGALRRETIAAAVKDLEVNGELRRGSGRISPRSVRHSYTTLQTMLADAVMEGKIDHNPASLRARRDEIPTVKDKDPLWRRTAVYTATEIALLTTDARISCPERVAYALEALAGLRYGEASALRWMAYDPDADPLGRLSIHEAYDSNNDRLKGVKTDAPRDVPVHPELARILEDWWATGWKRAYGRPPKAGDLVIPVREGTLRHRHKMDGYKPHLKALELLGLAHRRQHDLRRTFVTLCIAGGADKDLLKWITHGPPRGVMIDAYTSPPWDLLCAQVQRLKLA
jgi:integrase